MVWSDERWLLARMDEQLRLPFAAMLMPRQHLDLGDLDDAHAADLGRLTVLLDRAVRRLPDVERCHVNKWGDGGAHLHVAFLGRPTGMLQLRGSNLALWDDMLPPLPAPVADAALYPRGQCGVTALVLQDHLGGELLLAEVTYEGGGSQGVHFMNRLRDGTEVDLTREQFAPHELVGEPRLG